MNSALGGTVCQPMKRRMSAHMYAFDPRRITVLLIGGDKTGVDRWYETFVPVADRLYDNHLALLKTESERKRIVARKFVELESKMSPESISRSDEKVKALRRDMALNELRAALDITQQHLAKRMGVNQAAISKLERRADMYVSTLSDFHQGDGRKFRN